MQALTRRAFVNGWMPDADPQNGPVDGFLRFDNCVLDELGAAALRKGSAKINSSAFADTDIHSLFTAVLSGTRYRMAGAGSAVYANGASIASGVAGSGDISFGSHMGQILIARSTTKKKYDGSTVRNWGIAMTGGAPTVAALAPDSKTFATFASGETTWSCEEGTSTSMPGNVTGQDGTASGAIYVDPDEDTGRATITKLFAAAQNFTAYDAGQVGTDADLIEFYLYVTEPERLLALTLMIDVNPDSTNRFQDDYYMHEFQLDEPVDLGFTDESFMENDYTAEGVERRTVIAKRFPADEGSTVFRRDKPVSNAGWNKIQIRRGRMRRVGTTSAKGWDTVIAVRLTARMSVGGADSQLRFDDLKIVGGADRPLTGKAKYAYALVRDDGTYQSKSPVSTFSSEFLFDAQGGNITVPADASRDSQVNKIWLYRFGGEMDAFYRVATASVSGTGSVAISDTLSDRDAMILNIRMETDNAVPPDSIIDIEGPYYDRTFCLTASFLYPSKRLNPDSYAAGQVIRVAAADEEAFWVKKALGGLYIGTSKDIYRLDGTGAELPDGTMDFTLAPLNIDAPPRSNAVAQEGNLLVYLAADGWRAISGGGSKLLTGPTSLLYKGYTRHGVSPVNLSTGRFRAAITKGQLVALTPEGASTTSSAVLYRYAAMLDRWYRHTYPQAFRCVTREPDGTLIASDASGFVWTLDSGTQDGTTDLSVTIWTKADDDAQPFFRKDPLDLRVQVDTGGAAASCALHLDGSSSAAATVSVTQSGLGVGTGSLAAVSAFRQIQMRLTGSFSTFRLVSYAVGYEALPQTIRGQLAPQHFGYPGIKTLSGLQLRVCTFGSARSITPYLDGTAGTAFSVTSGADEPTDVTHAFTSPQTAAELALAFDGDVELYDWQPIITAKKPLGVKAFDTGPMDLGVHELVWIREVRLKVRASADLTVTPYFDDVAFDAVTIDVATDVTTIREVYVGRGYKGRIPRLVITSDEAFFPYWVKLKRRTTGEKVRTPEFTIPLNLGGEAAA